MQPTIEVTIDPNGEVTITVKGVKGPQCEAMTRELEDQLGVRRAHSRLSEYYQRAQNQAKNVGGSS
jgi:hypothetical protein